MYVSVSIVETNLDIRHRVKTGIEITILKTGIEITFVSQLSVKMSQVSEVSDVKSVKIKCKLQVNCSSNLYNYYSEAWNTFFS